MSEISKCPAPSRSLQFVLIAILALQIGHQVFCSLNLQKTLGWDASMGFLTLQSSLEHGNFNWLRHPAPEDLTQDRAEYITWWTPGQYMVPYWFSEILGTDIGTALRIVSILCILGGITGYCLLYIALGFSRISVFLTLVLLCSQSYVLKTSSVYYGGDLLLFAAGPFIALVALAPKIPLVGRALMAAFACLVAFFLKASSLTIFSALILYLALEVIDWPGQGNPFSRKWSAFASRLVILGGVFALYAVAVNWAYLSRGVSISSSAAPMESFSGERLWGVAYAVAGPLFGAFSFLDRFNARPFLIPAALLCGFIMWKLAVGNRAGLSDRYRRILVAHFAAFALFFSYAYLRGMDISYEPRHFRIVGWLLAPGLMQVLLSRAHRSVVGYSVAALSMAAVAMHHWEHRMPPAAGTSNSRWGIRQPISNASLEALHRADETRVGARTIVYNGFSACPSLLLEFKNGRRLQDDNFAYLGFDNERRKRMPCFHNSAESIVFIVPKNSDRYFGRSLSEIAGAFERRLKVAPCFENEELTLYAGRTD